MSTIKPTYRTKSMEIEDATGEPDHDGTKANLFAVIDAVDINTKHLRDEKAFWAMEKKEVQGCQGRVGLFVDSVAWEIVVTFAVLTDLCLTIASFAVTEEVAESLWMFLVGSFIMVILCLDCFLRIFKDGCKYWKVPLNWIEFAVAAIGGTAVALDIYGRVTGSGAGDRNPGASLGRTIRPAIRFMRVFRSLFNFVAGRSGLKGKIDKGIDKLLDRLVRKQLGDLMLCPGDNITIKPSQGQFHMEKAQVRTSKLGQLHAPFTVAACVVDMVHFEFKLGKLRVGTHRLMLVVENLILVVKPGHHNCDSWDFDDVRNSKADTLRLVHRILEPGTKPRKTKVQEGQTNAQAQAQIPGSMRQQKKQSSAWAKKKMSGLLRDVLNNGLHFSVNNVEIRYEDDSSDICGPVRVVGGVSIERIQLRAVSAGQGHGREGNRFRAKGLWRPGLQGNAVGGAQLKSAFQGFVLSAMVSMKNLFDFSHGVNGSLHGNGLSVYWDIVRDARRSVHLVPGETDPDYGANSSSRYGIRLKDGSGFKVSEFLKQRERLRKWEKVRLKLVEVILERMLQQRQAREGVFASPHRLREKARRLRDTVGQHHYLVEPVDFNVHFLVLPSKGSGDKPNVDADIYLPEVSFLMDMAQMKSLFALLGYLQRWQREELAFQWRPAPLAYRREGDVNKSRLSRGRLLWAFAYRLVLKSIHPKYPWATLGWMGIRRVAAFRNALFEELMKPDPNWTRIEVLQVGLPLPEAIAVRKEALIEIATRKKEAKRQQRRVQILCCCKARSKAEEEAQEDAQDEEADEDEDAGSEGDEEEVEEETVGPQEEKEVAITVNDSNPSLAVSRRSEAEHLAHHGSRHTLTAEEKPKSLWRRLSLTRVQGRTKDKLDVKAALEFVQIKFKLKTFCVDLLLEADRMKRRRALLRFGTVGMEALAVKGAPYELWSLLAPPIVVTSSTLSDDKIFLYPAVAVRVNEASAVFSAAPNQAPELRSVLAFDRKFYSPGRSSHHRRPAVQIKAAQLKNVAMTEEEAAQSIWGRLGAKAIPSPWQLSVCVEPFQANLCKPFLFKLKWLVGNYLNVPIINPAERIANELPGARDLEDPCNLWVHLDQLRKKRQKRKKAMGMAKKIEMGMGQRGPLANGQRFTGSIVLPGGLKAMITDIYTSGRWVQVKVNVPPGSTNFKREGWPIELAGGYRPFSALGYEACLSQDGWWFESQEQRNYFESVKEQGGLTEEQAKGEDDEWFADAGGFSDEAALANATWGEPAVEGLGGSPPNFSLPGLPKALEEPAKKLKQLPAFACPGMNSPAVIIAADVAMSAARSVAKQASTKIPFCAEAIKSKELEKDAEKEKQIKVSHHGAIGGMDAHGHSGAEAFSWSSSQRIDQDIWSESISVKVEGLPDGAMGLPAPKVISEWWDRLGLVYQKQNNNRVY
eukprot:TRINITY_DN28962_c0_g2_i1.p1 TRINITY_DN28962_c0_g2~~TRINITY_DN28962_c0_g2_i1.p1  ORF type:complete len:1423 (-),score=264.23 TRINITY_DN28962_c0_g2_i1:187-4455(-)